MLQLHNLQFVIRNSEFGIRIIGVAGLSLWPPVEAPSELYYARGFCSCAFASPEDPFSNLHPVLGFVLGIERGGVRTVRTEYTGGHC